MHLTLFHTAPANEVLFTSLLESLAPTLPARHIVRQDLLDRATALGCVNPDLAQDTIAALTAATQETSLLLCTCSTIGACADQVRAPIPVLRIDRPMAYLAAAAGPRILIAACLPSTVLPTQDLVAEATANAPTGATRGDVLLLPDAWPHWQRNDKPAYWSAIASALRPQAAHYDAILLAQASMAGAADLLADLPIPVLSSPRTGLTAALAQLEALPPLR